MALFALWYDRAGPTRFTAAEQHARLRQAAHVAPERARHLVIETDGGRWHLASFATGTHFYPAQAQVWSKPNEACVIHGLIWRLEQGRARLLDAAAVAALLAQPGARLPADIAGEYAVLRLHRCGTAEAFSDPAALHQLFHRTDGMAAVANRAGLLATLADQQVPDRTSALWLTAMGYRAGTASGWAGVSQLDQGARLTITGTGTSVIAAGDALALPPTRGFDEDLFEAGLAQARAAVLLAVGDGPLDLPITGGKDSRAVLAIALAAGLRERMTLFTRGYAGHPDVVVGAQIAAAIGVPHRREPPLGSDAPADLDAAAFMRVLATIAYQADGAMGGWDNVAGTHVGRQSLITGHFGELLKAYAKRPADTPLDPAAMVRLQGPFDPLGLLSPRAHRALNDTLAAQIDAQRIAGAAEDDLPDLFYWRNRIPNWLGGIRGIKSFERQPVLPLGVPALMRLAFAMTADERRSEVAHYRIVARCAPDLLAIPFAHQSWPAALADAPHPAPVLAAEGAPLFGSWQWAINRSPAVRQRLTALFEAIDIPLWDDVDRTRLVTLLRDHRFDYLEGISLLGLAVAAFHQAGLVVRQRLVAPGETPGVEPIAGALGAMAEAPDEAQTLRGYVDAVTGAAQVAGDTLMLTGAGTITITGWAQVPDWPGASPVVEARADGALLATAAATTLRPDLRDAGIGHGRYGFSLSFAAGALAGARRLTIGGVAHGEALTDGAFAVDGTGAAGTADGDIAPPAAT
jgi:hypothetical protein